MDETLIENDFNRFWILFGEALKIYFIDNFVDQLPLKKLCLHKLQLVMLVHEVFWDG